MGESGSNEGEDSLEESWEESSSNDNSESGSNEGEDSWEESSSNEMDSNEDSWDESEDPYTETQFPSNPETTFASSSSFINDFDDDGNLINRFHDDMDLAFEDVLIQDPVVKKVDLGEYSSSSGSRNLLRVLILSGITILLGAVQLV